MKSKDSKRKVSKMIKPKFRKYQELTVEQRTDPDYRVKELMKLSGDESFIGCTKCHHCR
ncbi:MAG: hypothetical protein AB1401_00380 [Thermodesulfobacteriota bacterium]